jgi:two-component system, cell cycle response regulator DivK
VNLKRILIVDDNASHMKLAAHMLELGGYQVLQAASADEGIELARTEHPAMILMDLRLPGKDGLTAIRELKADPATCGIRIVAVTSYRAEDSEHSIRASGADGFIFKPYHYGHFLGTVETLLEQPGRDALAS